MVAKSNSEITAEMFKLFFFWRKSSTFTVVRFEDSVYKNHDRCYT